MKQTTDPKAKRSAIFIMPRSSKAWIGAEALWITVAGWSAAAKRSFGNAWVLTSDRIAQPEEVIHYPMVEVKSSHHKKTISRLRWLPTFFKTLVKDILLWMQSRRWKKIERPWNAHKVVFVWEQHDLFPGPGRQLATQLKVPLVMYVHAPVVWEAEKWGVRRYLWGKFLERFVESRSLSRADLVACVSSEVASKLVEMGVAKHKIIVSPMAVDPNLFQNVLVNPDLRQKLGLENKLVIGWTGSFRSFHGLDLLVKAFCEVNRQNPETFLLLVGDGAERESTEDLIDQLKLTKSVGITGRQPFAAIPSYVALFDIAVVSARSAAGFHYSPLKLREYLMAGKPVLAPEAGDIPDSFKDGYHVKLYEAGDITNLTEGLLDMIKDSELRSTMAAQGKALAMESGTWDFELRNLNKKLSE